MPAASGATTLVPGDPARVAAVERIFERYATLGMGLGAVAASLNREGLPSPFAGMAGKRGGGTWGTGTIREILRNPAYAGSMAWNRKSYAKFHSVKDGRAVERSKVDGGRSCQNAESDWEIVPDAHEALVPKALFDEANRLLKQRAGTTTDRGTRATKRNSVYLLSGLVRCGRCGSRFQGYKTIKGRRTPGARRIETLYYACGGYVCHGNAKCRRALIAKDEFERLVTAATREHLESFSVGAGAGLLLEALAAESPDAEAVAKREADLRRRAADERKRLDGMVACLTPELAPVLGEKILEAKRKAEALAAEADAAARERTAAKDAAALSAALIRDAAAIGAAMEHATFHETREILRNLVVEVMIDPGRKEGEIVFHAAPLTATAAAGMDPAELDARVARTIAARTDAAAVEAGTAPDGAKEAAAHAAGEAITPEMNKDATVGDDHVLSLVMAGAGVARLKRAVVLFNSGRRARWAA